MAKLSPRFLITEDMLRALFAGLPLTIHDARTGDVFELMLADIGWDAMHHAHVDAENAARRRLELTDG